MRISLRSKIAAVGVALTAALGTATVAASPAQAAPTCVRHWKNVPTGPAGSGISYRITWKYEGLNSAAPGYASEAVAVSVYTNGAPPQHFTYADGNDYTGVWRVIRTAGQKPDGTMSVPTAVPGTFNDYSMGPRYPGTTNANSTDVAIGKPNGAPAYIWIHDDPVPWAASGTSAPVAAGLDPVTYGYDYDC